jgi:hypothetical protein
VDGMKVCCPQCGTFWKPEFKFCPNDGTNLDEIRAMLGEQEASETIQPMTPDDVVVEDRVVEVVSDDVGSVADAVEEDAGSSDAPARRPRPKRSRPSRRSDTPQVPADAKHDTIVDEVDRASASEPLEDEEDSTSEPSKHRTVGSEASRRNVVTDPGFSETQWFMKGLEVDADILEAKADEEEYQRDESIRTVVRKQFTLREEQSEE